MEELDAPQAPSKSQVKRELLALQDLAERLVNTPRSELERLDLSEATWSALEESDRIKDRRARRRHFKRIAKLLAAEDLTAVHALMDKNAQMSREAAARHHQVERWRERLIEEGDGALRELLDLCPQADRQRLRQLVRTAQRERGGPDAARKLFRTLRETLEDRNLS